MSLPPPATAPLTGSGAARRAGTTDPVAAAYDGLPAKGVHWKQMQPTAGVGASTRQIAGRWRSRTGKRAPACPRSGGTGRAIVALVVAALAAVWGWDPAAAAAGPPNPLSPQAQASAPVTAQAPHAAQAQPAAPQPPPGAGQVLLINVEGLITAGTAAFIQDRINPSAQPNLRAVVIRLDTPGGLVDPTLDILQAISAATVPVITYVGPEGAIAASAGSFILVSGHLAAMAPGTTTGAAMPVAVDPTGGNTQPADDKTVNFLAGHLRSVARERGRPADVIQRFITENLTLDARDALEQGVIDLLAPHVPALLEQVDGMTVRVAGTEVILHTAGAEVVEARMSPGQRLRHIVGNPQMAFLLLIGGAYALYVGFSMPGTLIPETLGGVLVLLGLFGLGLFEANVTGLLLLGLGLLFLVLELFTPTFGALTAAGVVSLVLGSLLLPAEPLLPETWFRVFRSSVLGVGLGLGAFAALVVAAVIRSRRQAPPTGDPIYVGRTGRVVDRLDPEGTVRMGGELWRARSSDGHTIDAGTEVEIVDRSGLTLLVRPVPTTAKEAE